MEAVRCGVGGGGATVTRDEWTGDNRSPVTGNLSFLSFPLTSVESSLASWNPSWPTTSTRSSANIFKL